MNTKERLFRLFEIASLKCSCCGELGHSINKLGKIEITKTPEHYNINSIEDWNKKMDEEISWILSNKEEILSILPKIGNEWKESCKSVRIIIEKCK